MQLHSQSVLHTIHHRPNKSPFVINIEDTNVNEFRSHLISFERKQDAYKVAKMLEYYKTTHGSWPATEISTTSKFNIVIDNASAVPKRLQELYIQTWTFEELQEYMAYYFLHMMLINEMREHFRTSIYVYDYPTSYVRNRLEEDLDLDLD